MLKNVMFRITVLCTQEEKRCSHDYRCSVKSCNFNRNTFNQEFHMSAKDYPMQISHWVQAGQAKSLHWTTDHWTHWN